MNVAAKCILIRSSLVTYLTLVVIFSARVFKKFVNSVLFDSIRIGNFVAALSEFLLMVCNG